MSEKWAWNSSFKIRPVIQRKTFFQLFESYTHNFLPTSIRSLSLAEDVPSGQLLHEIRRLQIQLDENKNSVSLKQVSELLDKKLAKMAKNGNFEPIGGLVDNQEDIQSTQP